ncbi:hypothetical protein SM907_24520 (plasmid) [Klebsiella aerogenes]|uniref:hypothetical protein n=1 Tax=Klebsiella aerogenes TaxID=548 RepID=UPI002A83ADDE|nr:hypothetical protein [Klebsiella aerogenes]WPS11033.1 hypothetical protein SM907_24520 [Klebsiella aerogenes]
MTVRPNEVAAQALQILKEKLHDWRDGPDIAWRSTWPVFERLIARHDEMKPVYAELQELHVTEGRLWILLEQCIFAGTFATADNHAGLRADYSELQSLSEDIPRTALRLEAMLRRRSDILNRSGSFTIDRLLRLTDFLDEAGRENSLYRSYIQPRLEELNGFDLKYWPDIADLLQVLGGEDTEVQILDEATAAIVSARRASLTDFFKDFFGRLHNISDGSWYGLKKDFRLSDSAIATLSNILCDRLPDEMMDEGYVKRVRQRLREQGVTLVW